MKRFPSEEDISYEMSVNDKRYQAAFYFIGPDKDNMEAMNTLVDSISEYMTPEQIEQTKAILTQFMELPEEKQTEITNRIADQLKKRFYCRPEKIIGASSHTYGWNEKRCRRLCLVHDQ